MRAVGQLRVEGPEAVEELPVAEEDRLQRRHAQRLPEPARPRAEEERAARLGDEPVQVRGLVHIEKTFLAQGLEVCDVGCDRFHVGHYTKTVGF